MHVYEPNVPNSLSLSLSMCVCVCLYYMVRGKGPSYFIQLLFLDITFDICTL